MKIKSTLFCFFWVSTTFLLLGKAFPQQTANTIPTPINAPIAKKLKLVHATMCEKIKELNPENESIAFSIAIEKVYCFTFFDPVPEKMFIYHNWFHKNNLSRKIKLLLQPPRWSTFSTVQLRETDKGPWRVEIIDQEGNILHILRFSITD